MISKIPSILEIIKKEHIGKTYTLCEYTNSNEFVSRCLYEKTEPNLIGAYKTVTLTVTDVNVSNKDFYLNFGDFFITYLYN